ncbi:hypothetical protein [Streptomyces acidiscabies]|uniref:hypothetical protein n=1 Tax=Streptomyces acidiscabies TaxID=42234 RepID=UPI000952429C|nr:hypothetical protein [Streptomyces acidiscabies]
MRRGTVARDTVRLNCFWRRTRAAGTPAEWGTEALRTANEPPDVYVCGPPPLVESVTDSALAGGVPADRIFRERFLPT